VQLHELACERQAQPGPLELARGRAAGLAEFLEDDFLVRGRDADPGVAHRDFDQVAVLRRAQVDPAAFGRELQRIGQQVEQDLFHLALVGGDRAHAGAHVERHRHAVARGGSAHERQRVVEHVGQAERRQVKFDPAGLDLGKVEDVVDQR
jgi:hypothetical protein